MLSISPELRLYLSPIQFDPEKLPPGLAITTPGSFVGVRRSLLGLSAAGQGILFTNFKLDPAGAAGAKMGDVMPTILDLYRVQPPERLDGKSLLPSRR